MNGKVAPLYFYAFMIVILVFAAIFSGARGSMRAQDTSAPTQTARSTLSPQGLPQVSVATATAALAPASPAVPAVPPTAAPSAASSTPALSPAVNTSQQALLAKHGDAVYSDLQLIPPDLRDYYLYWVFRAQAAYGVPAEDILAVHFAEQMGAGLRPLETRTSSAGAVGPGQITAGYWNGWAAGSPRNYFLSDVGTIQSFGGCGVDFDGNGVADPGSIADNIAATACGLARDHVRIALRGTSEHASVLANALCIYNSGKACVYAAQITRDYAQYGINWMLANGAAVQALASRYLH